MGRVIVEHDITVNNSIAIVLERRNYRGTTMASRIRELREKRGWTQTDLAEQAGLQQSTVSKLERRPGLGDRATFEKIAAALGVSADDIVQDDEPVAPDPRTRPVMASLPGWETVLERAKSIAPDVDADSWALLEASPGLLSIDVPLTPSVVADLGRLVQKHAPVRKR
jgi:transcriptional regulator with XRE-family HTH domain